MPPKRRAEEIDSDNGLPDSSAKYPILKRCTKQVPQATVTSRWTTLSGISQEQAHELFLAAERPVVMRCATVKLREEAQAALAPVMKILRRKLPRMAFPSRARENQLDYEALSTKARFLDAQLTGINHSIALRQAEIAREENLLERDRVRLAVLERDAAREEATRQQQTRKGHPLLRDITSRVGVTSTLQAGESGLAQFQVSEKLDALCDDPQIRTIMRQLHSHLDSMHTNVAPVAGLVDDLQCTKAEIDRTLRRLAGSASR